MDELGILKEMGQIIYLPTKSFCRDKRKVPANINLEKFVQLNVYIWQNGAPYEETIFVYNPFNIFPITLSSITDTIDPNRTKYQKNHRKRNYYLYRKCYDELPIMDPVHFNGNAIIIFEERMPDAEIYFQYNQRYLETPDCGLIKITKKNFCEFFKQVKKFEVYQGPLEQKMRDS